MEEEKKEETTMEEKKGKNILSTFKNFAFWLLIIIYLEFTYRLSMGMGFNVESFINIILHGIIVGSFLSIISRIFKDKVNNWITAIVLLILGILFSVQCVFTKIFTTNFSLSNLALGDQAVGFIGDAFKRNRKQYTIYSFIFVSFCLILST